MSSISSFVTATGGLNSPFDLAFDSAGNLFVSNQGDNTILKFSPDGTRSVFASTVLNIPTGLAFDSVGNLYAANYGDNTIAKFTPEGLGSIFASGGNGSGGVFRPHYLAFTDDAGMPLKLPNQVPEQSAFALLGLASMALGFSRRRH